MPTSEELKKTYSRMATGDLLQIIAHKGNYTAMAIDAVNKELRSRNVSPQEIKTAHAPEDPYKKLWMQNSLCDLAVWQKTAFYFLSAPMFFIERFSFTFNYQPSWMRFKARGYILKGQQVSLYRITGVIFFIISVSLAMATNIGGAGVIFFTSLILGFGLTWCFDLSYNRQRLVDKLQNHKNAGELPWGV